MCFKYSQYSVLVVATISELKKTNKEEIRCSILVKKASLYRQKCNVTLYNTLSNYQHNNCLNTCTSILCIQMQLYLADFHTDAFGESFTVYPVTMGTLANIASLCV